MKKNKTETILFIPGYQRDIKDIRVLPIYYDIVSGINNNKLFLHTCSI